MPDGDESLGPYTLLGRIGAGGMGEVWLARDPRLEREVALKLLPAGLRDDPERRQRFLREARAAAKLSHPNVTAIHEVGEADGRDYIAFEYVEGQTLDAVVRGRRLPLAELIDLALPLADALAYAHERGVLHRDLKAANVMVTPRGHPKLLDFGLAKLLDEAGTERERRSTTLTVEGAIFGTPQAMSPEQALGRSVDERSDVFSFGSLLYEMAAGRPAFEGGTVMEVMDAVIHAEPSELGRLRPDLPAELGAIVAKAMRKDPGERYPSIAGLVADLRHFKRKTESGLVPPARARRSRLPTLLGAGTALVALCAWLLLRPERAGDAGAVTAAAIPGSIAVMGFELLGAPASGADGSSLDRALTSLVTTALAESGGIEVASSSKVLACLRRAGQATGAAFDPGIAATAAREARVEVMLVGQVLARGSGLLLTAELVDVASGNARGSLRREVASEEELFALAEGLAGDVRERLGLAAERAAGIDLEEDLTDSPEAYYKFVAGEMAIHEARFFDARRLLTQAVEIDPSFAFAWVRLGIATEWEGEPAAAVAAYEQALAHGERLPPRWRRLVRIVLDYNRGELERVFTDVRALLAGEGSDLPEAHNTLGEVLTHSSRHRDPEGARAEFLRAIEIDPNFQIVLYHVVGHSIELGEVGVLDELLARLRADGANPEGVVYLELGRDLERRDFASAAARIQAAGRESDDVEEYLYCLCELGRLDEAEALLAGQSPEPGSNALRNLLSARGTLAFRRGRIREALELYRSASRAMSMPGRGTPWFAANLANSKVQAAHAAFLLGSLDEALALLDEGLALDPFQLRLSFWKARWLAGAGRTDEAQGEVERMRTRVRESVSPIAPSWLVLAEAELALARGELEPARERLASLADTPLGARPWAETELVRADLAGAAGEHGAEVAARRTALHAAHDFSESNPDLVFPLLHDLADAEERAGLDGPAREHGGELLALWEDAVDEPAILADARRRWAE